MDLVPFGKALFSSADLDPIYVALGPALSKQPQLYRWLVAYWCFYHAGFACYASEHEGADYWEILERAAANADLPPVGDRWPRGTERRHFRGEASKRAVAKLRKAYRQPEQMVDRLLDGPSDIRSVIDRVREHYLFGPWIAFKVADMLDGCVGAKVLQNDMTLFLYDTPRESIQLNIEADNIPGVSAKNLSPDSFIKAMRWLQRELRECQIPHKPHSTPDWFSIETVWCKHLSHCHGHYPLYKDIYEIRHGLEPWLSVSKTAKRFFAAMPRIPGGLIG